MGLTSTRRLCKSVISFERARGYTEEDLPYFRGTISCRPCNDTPSQTLSNWEIMEYDTEGSLVEAREW